MAVCAQWSRLGGMDTNMVYGIIAVVVIAVLLIVGGIWMDRSRKKNIQQSQEAAKAKADERLAAERAAQKPTVPEPAEAKQSPAEQTPDALAPPAEAPVEEVETVEETGVVEEPVPPVEKPEGKKGRLQRLRERLSKSGNPFGKALFNILAKDHLSETDWEDVEDTLLLADVMSGAMLKNIVDRVKTKAVKESVRQGRDVPVDLALVHAAVDEECDSARATLAEVNLEQWVRTNGFDARRITDLRALTAHAADEAEGTYGMEQA